MANVKINGIVIAENNMGDYDKMLTILTPNYGKISCVAKGARRPQSALLAGTQLFCFGEYMMYKGTNTYHINSCETIEIFYNLRTDLDKLKYAIHINKIIQDVPAKVILENWEGKNNIVSVLKTLAQYVTDFTRAKNVETIYGIIDEIVSI